MLGILPALLVLTVFAVQERQLVEASGGNCSSASTDLLRHWATLELAGVPVFVHQRLDQRGHFLLEPLLSLPTTETPQVTINASCVRLDRLTGGHYLSFPVALRDDELLHQAREKLRHAAPRSVAFLQPAGSSLPPAEDLGHLHGGWRLESLRISSEGRLGYLRVNCPHHRACVELRSELVRGNVEIFERFLLRLDTAVSPDGCASVSNLTKPVVVPRASQIDVAHFARRPRVSEPGAGSNDSRDDSTTACGKSTTVSQLSLHRDFYIDGRPVFVMMRRESAAARAPHEFWLEPLLSLDTGEGAARPFRNASGWPGVALRLRLREPQIRRAAVRRLRQPTGPIPILRYLHLVDWRLERRSHLAGVQVDRLRLSTDREVAYIRLMAPNDTLAGVAVVEELSRQIAANPTLLFDALRFSFAFSPDEATSLSSSCEKSPAYWASRRPVAPHLSQFPVDELQRRWQDHHGNGSRCRLSMQPQVAKVVSYRGQPLVLWKRLDHPDGQQPERDDYLIEPLFLLRNEGLEASSFSVAFDYTRSAHYVSCRVDLQSDKASGLIRQNLTHLARFRSAAFALIGNLSISTTANISGITAAEFYTSYDQRNGFLRLYCDRLTTCAGLRNYLSKSSELFLERLQLNITMATPDDGCLAPDPTGKLILARRHLIDLAYLREKSPPRLVCAEAAYPRVQAPVQPPGSCQLVLHRSTNFLGGLSHFVEPAFCLHREPPTVHFDYVRNRPYLKLRMALANASLLLEVQRGLRDAGTETAGASAPAATDENTIDFMELWSFRLKPRARLPGLEAGDFKVAFDRSEAELRIHCQSGGLCRSLQLNMEQNSTLLLENFNLEITANLPSYDCWMPQRLRKRIMSRNATYFDLSYLNGKTRRLPGCPRRLPMRLFGVKSVDGCTTVVHKREDTKAEFYIEPLFCFNGRVELGYSYLTGSPYASLGVDLSRQSVLDSVTAQLANLAPKRVAFLQVRKVNLTRKDLGSEAYQLDSFSATVDRSRGEFRVLCQTWTACWDLSSNLTAQPWLAFERIQLETLMANIADCELSTATHQQPTSSAADFHLPLETLQLKLPDMRECAPEEAPRHVLTLSLDGCPVAIYQLPGELLHQRSLLIEPLLCFHGNNASSSLNRGRDFLSGEEFVSIRLLLRSHGVMTSVQEQLSLPALEAGSMLRFAELWDVGVTEEASAAGLRVARLGIAADGENAELRVACSSWAACQALVQSLTEEPTDYLRSILFSVSSLTPSRSCYFKAPTAKRPLIIGYSWDRRCLHDSLGTGQAAQRSINLQLWTVQRCHPDQWTACEVSRSGRSAHFFSRSPSDWADARRTCRSIGADLAVIDSSEENAEVFAHLVGDSWIGMYRSGGRFVWVGGPIARSEGYQNFAAGSEAAEQSWQFNCLAMSGVSRLGGSGGHIGGVWQPATCHRQLRFVCEYSV